MSTSSHDPALDKEATAVFLHAAWLITIVVSIEIARRQAQADANGARQWNHRGTRPGPAAGHTEGGAS